MMSVHSAMILCAGLGTRLRPLSEWLAKPMVPVGDAPVVARIASRIRASGIARVAVNVHHRPDDVRAWAEREAIGVSHEPVLLGTAGGIARAAPLLGDGDVLVWNGDIWSELDVASLIDAHAFNAGEATLAVIARGRGEGNIGLAADGRVVRLRTSRFGEEASGADFVGIYVLGAALRATLPEEGCSVGDVLIPALARGAAIFAHAVRAPFHDVGSLGAYAAANAAWLAARGASSWAAPDAIVGASIEGSVVGAGARVDAPAIRSIVWPGTHVRVAIEGVVATPFGEVIVG